MINVNNPATTPGQIYGRPWSEREYIIALYYYLKNSHDQGTEKSSYVRELAAILGRTVASVLMRLENYAALDPRVARKGLRNVGPIGYRVFERWFKVPDQLNACAEVLVRESKERSQPTLFDPNPVKIPQAFGKYELLDLIGEGACGVVYSCTNSEDQKVYALKIIRTDKVSDEEILGRFRREIRLLKSRSHPNIIKIYEDNLGELQSFPGFIMEFANTCLRQYIESKMKGVNSEGKRPLLPTVDAVTILRQILNAVASLHSLNDPLIHRDINPNNILLLSSGQWVLSDFSLGKFFEPPPLASTFVTQTCQGWGTQPYAAPEQWRDFKRVDQRADIYALGILTWELFCASWPPFDRSDIDLSPALKALVLRATCRNRDERHSSIHEFITEFEAAIISPTQ